MLGDLNADVAKEPIGLEDNKGDVVLETRVAEGEESLLGLL